MGSGDTFVPRVLEIPHIMASWDILCDLVGIMQGSMLRTRNDSDY